MLKTASPSRPARTLISFVVALVVLVSSVYACSNQGEGERCDTHNGNDDCLSGLVCTARGTLGTDSDRCCPANRTQASADVCKQTATPSGGDASIPTEQDGATADSSTTDASDDAAADASDDSSVADSSVADSGDDDAAIVDAGTGGQ